MVSPYLEKLILTGQAQYRRETVGLSGTMRVDVPAGCYLVITELELLPLCQTRLQSYGVGADNGALQPVPTDELEVIQYQVRAIIDNATTHNYAYRAGLQTGIGVYAQGMQEPRYVYAKTPVYDSTTFGTYWIVKSGISFNFIMPRQEVRLWGAQTNSVYLNDKPAGLGPISSNSTTYYRASLNTIPGGGLAEYYPQLPENFTVTPNPNGNGFIYFTMSNDFANTRVRTDVSLGTDIPSSDLLNLPLVNVEFVIINSLEANQGSGIMKPDAFRY